MHDGSVASLCDALRPHARSSTDELGPAPSLSPGEQRDLLAFLRSLSSPTASLPADEAHLRCGGANR